MRQINISIIFVLLIFALVSCTNNQNELDELEVRISKIEQASEDNVKLTDELKIVSEKIIKIEEEIDQIKANQGSIQSVDDIKLIEERIVEIKTQLSFLNHMLFGNSLFDRNTLKVGDHIADMKLIEKSDSKGMQFLFSGEKVITGTYKIYSEDEYWGDTIFFYADEKITDILPRAIGDQRTIWFRFSNYDEVVEMLKPYEQNEKLTITIDQYYINLLESDVINEAHIINVIEGE